MYLYLTEFQSQNPFRFHCQFVNYYFFFCNWMCLTQKSNKRKAWWDWNSGKQRNLSLFLDLLRYAIKLLKNSFYLTLFKVGLMVLLRIFCKSVDFHITITGLYFNCKTISKSESFKAVPYFFKLFSLFLTFYFFLTYLFRFKIYVLILSQCKLVSVK